MVAKGLDFDNVTLVGIIDADQSLYAEDYRSHERTFSLVTQVVGRAGRGGKPGRAVCRPLPRKTLYFWLPRAGLRCILPGGDPAQAAALHASVLRALSLTVSAADETGAMKAAFGTADFIRGMVKRHRAEIRVMGPTQASVYRMRNQYRFQITLAALDTNTACKIVSLTIKMFNNEKRFIDCKISADFKPNSQS